MNCRMSWRCLFFLLIGTVAFWSRAEGFCWYFPLDYQDAEIRDAGPMKLRGHYYPCASPDNDTPETSNPARYRLSGHRGKSLFFFRDLGSAGQLDTVRALVTK